MVRLRNPWPERQWSGRAAEGDHRFWSSLSPADRSHLGPSPDNKGTFVMLWEDFSNYFFMVDICQAHLNANISSL